MIAPGGSATLYAPMSGGTLPYQCTLSGTDGSSINRTKSVATDSITFSVSPDQTTTYTLSCRDGAGASESDSAKITVSDSPVIEKFRGVPSSLPVGGGSYQLDYTVRLATSCRASGGTADWRSFTNFDLENGGRTPVWNLTKGTTFTLTCTNTSGKSASSSITINVDGTAGPLCGNGNLDAGEDCDLGSGNGTCPALCSDSCQDQYGCDSVATVSISARPDTYDPGETVKIQWSSTKAVNCEAKGGEGFSNPISTSGSVTVTPTRDFQNYRIECYDSGGKSVSDTAAVRKDIDEELYITSATVSPSPIPFGYAGNLTYSWSTDWIPDHLPNPECSLGYMNNASWITRSPWIPGKTGSTQLALSQVGTYGSVKRITLRCNIDNGTRTGIDEYRDIITYMTSDSSKAPVVALKIGIGGDRDESIKTLPASRAFKIYQIVGGAERCEYTEYNGRVEAVTPFIGEKEISYGSGLQQTATFVFQCWNGDLSSKAEAKVLISGSTDPSDDGRGSGGNPPGDGGPGTTICSAPNTCSDTCSADQRVGTCSSGGTYCCAPPTTTPPSVFTTPFSFGNPVAFSTVDGLFSRILSFLQATIVLLSLIFIIIGAFLYITSAGDEGRMTQGKKAILAALIGLALGIAAPAFLREIASILGWGTPNLPSGVGTSLTLIQIATNVLNFLLTIIGILAIIMLVIGGIMYLTAAGNEDTLDKGKRIVKYSLIGITIALASLVLVKAVAGLLG